MYVRLSDGVPVRPAKKKTGGEEFPFIYIPQAKMYVREDYLDDLDDREWRELMASISAYQPQVSDGSMTIASFMGDRAARKAKRATKAANKDEKQKAKIENSKAKAEIKKARAEAKKAGGGGSVLDTVMKGVGAFVGAKTGGDSSAPPDGGGAPPPPPPEPESSIPWVPIGIGAAVLIGGGIFLATRSKS